jgi:hypothetical protein
MAGSLFHSSDSSSTHLTGTGQMLEAEVIDGEKTSIGCSVRTHVHKPTKTSLRTWFTGLNMDHTNPKTGYVNLIIRLSSPYNFQLGQFLMITKEDKNRIMSSGSQKRWDLVPMFSGAVLQAPEGCVSMSRRQQRMLHMEDNWVETAKLEVHHLGGGDFLWKQYQDAEHFRLGQLKTRALINIVTLMMKHKTPSIFTLLTKNGLQVNCNCEALRNTIVKCCKKNLYR